MTENTSDTAGWRCLVPFPDGSESFVNGFEAGVVWERMFCGEVEIKSTLHTENAEVFRRMAAASGYDLTSKPTEFEEWTTFTFTKRRSRLTVVQP